MFSDGEERRTKKFSVAIRPLTPNRGASVDNVDSIRNVALNLHISPSANVCCLMCSLLHPTCRLSWSNGIIIIIRIVISFS